MTLNCNTICTLYTKNLKSKIKAAIAFCLFLCMMCLTTLKPVQNLLMVALSNLQSMGYNAIPWLFLLYVVCNSPSCLPTNALHAACGMMYGLREGSVIALMCYTVSAYIPFLCVTYCFQQKARNWFCKSKYYALVEAIEQNPFIMLLCARASLVVPGSMNNILFGFTNISNFKYLMGTAIGIAPQLIMYVYVGTIITELNVANMKEVLYNMSAVNIALLIFGIVTTVGMVAYITIKADRIIKSKIVEDASKCMIDSTEVAPQIAAV